MKFAARSAVLATDGFIVYDIQDEAGRTTVERPFPFKKTLDAAWYASLFLENTGKHCVVYKSVVEDSLDGFDQWIDEAVVKYGHHCFNLVGAPTSTRQYQGPTLQEAMVHMAKKPQCNFGCVAIPERHTKKGNENHNMVRKVQAGAKWFITQGVYHSKPIIRLIHDYASLCREKKITPSKLIITFAPCGRPKTMSFIKWLGMDVPQEIEDRIFKAEKPVAESILILSEVLTEILDETMGSGVPLGLNVESLSIFREEIDGAHELFQKLQCILLNSRGSPWAIKWYCVKNVLDGIRKEASEEDLYGTGMLDYGNSDYSNSRTVSKGKQFGKYNYTTLALTLAVGICIGYAVKKSH